MYHRYDIPRKDLMAFSAMGKKFAHKVVYRLYQGVVDKLERGTIKLGRARTIEQIVMSDTSVFRAGEMTARSKERKRLRTEYYKKLVKECRDERAKSLQDASQITRKRKRSGRSKKVMY